MLVQLIGQLRQRALRYVENAVVVCFSIHIPIVYLTHIEINFSLCVWSYIDNAHTSSLRIKYKRDWCDVGNWQAEGKVACGRYLCTKCIIWIW